MPRARPAGGTEALATEVSAQAARLQARMAQAPVPIPIPAIRSRSAPRRARRVAGPSQPIARAMLHATAAEEPAPAPPPLPALTLMGIAEETTAAGPRRTAVIGGDGDTIYMVTEGDAVGERYRVTKIGADAVELEDVLTKAYRRIALR